jgi:hypothetical protein
MKNSTGSSSQPGCDDELQTDVSYQESAIAK